MKPELPTIPQSTLFGLLAVFVFWNLNCAGQVSSNEPANWKTATSIDLGHGLRKVELSHNNLETIRQELSDSKVIQLIASSAGLSDADIATVKLVPRPNGNSFELYQLTESGRAFEVLSQKLRDYAEAREGGHTKEFLLFAITNRVPPLSIPDKDLRVLVLNEPFVPPSLMKKGDSGTRTNKAGRIAAVSTTTTIVNGKIQTTSVTNMPKTDEVCRWVSYAVTDGEIEWLYTVNFKENGRLDFIDQSRRDAKETDPKFKKTIEEVNKEVEAELKMKGILGQLGAVHEFWHLKKEKLKAKGITWRSPAELNPNAIYD